jgi:Uma2 family endonuclease
MIPYRSSLPSGDNLYLDSKGIPLSNDPQQLRWIAIMFGNLSAIFRHRPDVFVASNLCWYPVEGRPEIRLSPHVLVVFGRPKRERSSYRQWEEGGIPPTVVFEVLPSSYPAGPWYRVQDFYWEHGVEECYWYDPEENRLMAYTRVDGDFCRIRKPSGIVSARLGIRFDLSGSELALLQPDGRSFLTVEELAMSCARAEQRADEIGRQIGRLAELSRKARRGQASAEELRELEQLENQSSPPTA